jgi:hypothetical protein
MSLSVGESVETQRSPALGVGRGRAPGSPIAAAAGLAAMLIFVNLTIPHGIAFDAAGALLVVDHGLSVSAFTDRGGTCVGWMRTLILANAALTQGTAVEGLGCT